MRVINKIPKPSKYVEVEVKKLVFGGQGLGHVENKATFIWNALPGEKVRARVINSKKGVIEAVAEDIVNPSKYRVEVYDDHYLSSAPWQMMSEEYEKEAKVDIANEIFKPLNLEVSKENLVGGDTSWEYRNKMEFGFFVDNDDVLHLSLFIRGSRFPKPLIGCKTASNSIMKVAFAVLEWLRENKVDRFDLKSLILRSNLKGEVMIGLFVQNPGWNLKLSTFKVDKIKDVLKGFHIIYSSHKSPASIVSEWRESFGDKFLIEKLNGVELEYGLNSFFQINIPVFNKTLEKIGFYLNNIKKEFGKIDILDFYSGVGSIGIGLKDYCDSALLVDSNPESIEYAKKNIDKLGLKKYKAIASETEKILENITKDKVIILDPPRAGLHPDVVTKLLEVEPDDIIYLSCNASTQVRDVKNLSEKYDIVEVVVYDYFPRTPHFESLMILKKKKAQ